MTVEFRQHLSQVLKTVNANTKVSVLGDEETTDLIEHLKANGIDLTTVGSAIDLGGIKLIYTFFDRASVNNDFTELEDFKLALNSLNGKPLAIDHTVGKVVGHYVTTEIDKNKAVSYAVFYKRHFPDIWMEVQERAKAGTLRHSWNILHPKGSSIINKKGNEAMKNMILSGGSLVLNKRPAYSEAYVVKIAQKGNPYEKMTINCTDKLCNSYSTSEVITEENYLVCDKCGFNTIKSDSTLTKCPRCGGSLRSVSEEDLSKIKEEIKDNEVYVKCPNCGAKDWSIVNSAEDIKIVRCLSCLKSYEIKFGKMYFPFQTLTKREFKCPSCGWDLSFYTTNDAGKLNREVRCPNCGIDIKVPSNKSIKFKRIISIKQIEDKDENLEWFGDLLGDESGGAT